ncbi:MAG TPA: TadE family protein [Egibacteraceae bacterium]|nr:TadE family protein [Egibacteraceae bacterium]
MVLRTVTARGARTGAPRRRAEQGGDAGSQAVEFALVLPGIVLLLVTLLHCAIAAADLVAVQGIAREAARFAAVADDGAVRAAAGRAAGRRQLRVELSPPSGARRPGQLVTARVRLRSKAFAAFGADVWLSAQATMRVEDR